MRAAPALSAPGFGSAWFALCVAFVLHIIDEASTGFLAVYNPTVIMLRERWSGFPMPTFEFREWLATLIVACGLLFCLTPLAGRGMRGLRPLAWFYAVIMFLNGLGHTLLSILGHTVDCCDDSASGAGVLFFSVPVRGFSMVDVPAAAHRSGGFSVADRRLTSND